MMLILRAMELTISPERHNNQMGNSRSLLPHILRLVHWRPHTRKEAAKKGPTTAIIPSCTLSLVSSLCALLLTETTSSLSRTLNAAATDKSPRTTSPFTKPRTLTHHPAGPTRSTLSDRMAHGRNPRRCTKTTMRHHNTFHPRERQRPTPTRRVR